MASKTYRDQVIVLKKTKLKESDLILTLLAQDGRQIRAVAKGARKPTSSFAARLDLFSNARVFFAMGRSLDIVKEARLVDAHAALRCDVGLTACACPMAELLAKATQDSLPVPRLFEMTQAAFSSLEGAEGVARLLLCAAFLLKACAVLGFRPCLAQCAECGGPLPAEADLAMNGRLYFSAAVGGVVCPDCAQSVSATMLDREIARWAETLIGARFAEISTFRAEAATGMAVLRFVQGWTREHIGRLRSLDMLISQGVY